MDYINSHPEMKAKVTKMDFKVGLKGYSAVVENLSVNIYGRTPPMLELRGTCQMSKFQSKVGCAVYRKWKCGVKSHNWK